MSSDYKTQETVAKITAIHDNRTSSSGTPYCSIELEGYDGDWFFIWDGDFKNDVEDHKEIYQGAEVKVIVKDKEDEPGEHFYNVQQLWPTSQEKCEKLLQLKMSSDSSRAPDVKPKVPPEFM